MISITHEQITPRIVSLFDISKPTMLRAFNVLEGLNRGQILVDDPEHPTWAVVRDVIYGTLHFGGQVQAERIAALVPFFREIGEVGIACWPEDPLNEMIPETPDYDGRSLYFPERSQPSALQVPIPNGYQVAVRDQNLFRQSFDYTSTLAAFSTEENVLRHTFGVVVLHGEQVACEAGTGAPTHGQIEIGVTTHEAHRQRGLAYLACARLIDLCETHGYKTWWDCAKQNTASVRLAHKLGFHSEKEYRYVWWGKKT